MSKTKLISVRISLEDFSNYRQICDYEGFVTFSDLVRTALQELISNRSGHTPTPIHKAVQQLGKRIDKLDREFNELRRSSYPTAT